jgi:hypothetical protein
LKITPNNLLTDLNGLATITPSGGGFDPPVEVDVGATAGTTAMIDDPLEMLPALSSNSAQDERANHPQR